MGAPRSRYVLDPGGPTTNGHTARTYLLSGTFCCGHCGHAMYGRIHNGKPRYQCIKDPGRPICGKDAVYAHRADDEARDKILTALDGSPALLEALLRHHQASERAWQEAMRAAERREGRTEDRSRSVEP